MLDRKKVFPFKIKGVFFDRRYFHYTVKNPNPILMDKKSFPIVDAEQLTIILETKVLKDLNALGNNWLSQIKIQHVLIGLGVLVALYYFLSGGTLL